MPSKVKEFHSKEEFNLYWSFDLFELLNDSEDAEAVNRGVEKYFHNRDRGVDFRDSSVLKKILAIDGDMIQSQYKVRLSKLFFDPDFLSQVGAWYFKRIRSFVNDDTKFFSKLDGMVETVLANSYHYNLLSFYKKVRKGFDTKFIEERIEQIRLK